MSFSVTMVCLSAESSVVAMIPCPTVNRRRMDNMDNNLFIMVHLETLSYKHNNASGKKLNGV